jgi:hypothetical protein
MMKRSLLIALFSILPVFAQTATVKPEDFRTLTGGRWMGTLVYVDYRSNKEVSIPSNLTVAEAKGEDPTWIFEYEYPDEPKANSKENVKLAKNGTSINDETVVERASLDGGLLRVVTERRGKDNDRDALIRYTYTIGQSSFSIKKEVRPEGSTKFFERNRYSWRR